MVNILLAYFILFFHFVRIRFIYKQWPVASLPFLIVTKDLEITCWLVPLRLGPGLSLEVWGGGGVMGHKLSLLCYRVLSWSLSLIRLVTAQHNTNIAAYSSMCGEKMTL